MMMMIIIIGWLFNDAVSSVRLCRIITYGELYRIGKEAVVVFCQDTLQACVPRNDPPTQKKKPR
jgi:hypothetical protein